MALDRKDSAPFSFDDLYDAADRHALLPLLLKIDDSGIIELAASDPKDAREIEIALANAVEALRGREIRKTGVGDNPLCMVMALVLETIQQNFR
jgi:hypothetical protein